jgi:hypothetical protein
MQVMKITSDNNKLCKRLLEISGSAGKEGPLASPGRPGQPHLTMESAASINRRRAEDRIAQVSQSINPALCSQELPAGTQTWDNSVLISFKEQHGRLGACDV